MSVREYIGARYIPLFADPVEWDISTAYEPLTVVTHEGGSYVSKQAVPSGIDINNGDYWILWADYNAQIEAYRREVQTFDGRITANSDAIDDINQDLGQFEETVTANGWVTTPRIADEAVTSDKIADNAVTSDKIADEAVTAAKLAPDTIDYFDDLIQPLDDRITDNANDISDIKDEIGTGFSEQNTISEAIGNLADEISGKTFSQPAWNIIDRFIIDETANSGETTTAQAGCYFEQENTRYSATMINTGNAGGCNAIRIRNIDNDSTVVDFSISICHGLAIDYNPATKELLYYDEVLNSINIVSLATITNPIQVLSISTVSVPMWYGVCWYSEDEILVYREVSGDRICDIRKRDAAFTYVESFMLEGFEHLQTTVYQDCSYKNGVFAVLTSFPEAVILYDLENGSLINVINMPVHVGCSIIDEVEGLTITDDSIYVEHPNNVDNVQVVTWLEWNFKRGTLKADESIHLWDNTETVGTLLVNWQTGSLRDPISDNSRTFKLAGDAENFAKMNYPNETIIISFQSDYPLYFRMEACSANVLLGANDFPIGMRFSNMGMLSLDGMTGATCGAPITIDHSTCKITGGNLTPSGSNSVWTFNNVLCFTNSQLDKLQAQYTILLAPSKPTNSTAWKCHWATPQDNWN